MFTGLPCWSSHLSCRSGYTHTHQHSPGCHCPVTSNQQCEPLLTFSLAASTLLFVLKYTPLAMPKASYPSMESILNSYPQIHQNKFSCLYFDRVNCSPLFISWNCTPVLFPRIQFCFLITQLNNLNCIIDWNISNSSSTSTSISQLVKHCEFRSLVRRTLCAMPHIGCQFMSWYFNVHALGITNYK